MKGNRRVLVFQPTLPSYRVDFFDRLYERYGKNFRVYFSPGSLGALTKQKETGPWAQHIGNVVPFTSALEWQRGALSIPFCKGDVVVVSGGPRCITNILLLIKARIVGAKSVWWGHYWSSTSRKHRFWLRMLLMKISDSVLFYTDLEVSEYLASVGVNDKRNISALNNGLNVEAIQKWRSDYRSVERKNSILFIGRLTKKARLDLLIRAMADSGLQELHLDVVGGGEEYDSLVALASTLGVFGRITWHGELIEESEISCVANSCRYFVYTGAVGLSLIHAMAYGLPALVHGSRFLHMPEIAAFHDGVTGCSFQVDSVSSISSALRDLQGAHERLDEMSRASIGIVESKFTTKLMASRFINLLDRL